MAIAVYSESELRAFALLDRTERLTRMARMSIKEALIFRRNLQISLVKYAARHRQVGAYDTIVAGIYKALHDLESLTRRAFVAALAPQYARAVGNDAASRKRAKKQALEKWEKLLARSSY